MLELTKEFSNRLKPWFKVHRISHPWRETNDPYAILIAELMLHRTRALNVHFVYAAFLLQYPNLHVAAKGSVSEIRQILYPLGLTGRAERFIDILQELDAKYGRVVPDRNLLLEINGIGPYIAGAVVVFSTNKPEVLVDTNVVRVVGRVFGLQVDEGARRRKIMIDAIQHVVDQQDPRSFYHAVIDLAHKVCRPRNPLCNLCPLRDYPCFYALHAAADTIKRDTGETVG